MARICYTEPTNQSGTMEWEEAGATRSCAGPLPPLSGEYRPIYDKLIADGVTVEPYAAPAVDLTSYARSKRWEIENGGITVAGIPVATDDRSKLMITGGRVAAEADPNWMTVWDGADGESYPIDAAAMIAISAAVQAHVNACFVAFATVKAGIAAEPPTVTTTAQIDAAFAAIATDY
jgi:hypothetical protein